MLKYKLTVFVHNFNNQKYILKCLNSIISQKTSFRFCIIIIDDFSKDNFKQIVNIFKNKNKFKDIFIYSTQKNMGLGKLAAISLENKVKKYLFSDYYYRIDSDDYLINDCMFEEQVNFLSKNKKIVAVSDDFKICKNNILLKSPKVLLNSLSLNFFIKNIFIYNFYRHTSTYMFRNIHKGSIYLSEFKNNNFVHGDVLYVLCFLKKGVIKFRKKISSVYRINNTGIWTSLSLFQQKKKNLLLIFKMIYILDYQNKLRIIFFIIKNILIKFFYQIKQRILTLFK